MKSPNWLYEEHGYNVTSQHGEDGVIEKIFQTIKPINKFCVEFGAMDGIIWSNTYNLIMNHNWQSVQLEINPDYFKSLIKTYKDKPVVCLNANVLSSNLDKILLKNNAPKNFDLMSIDVDGNDYNIFKSMEAFRPQAILIECNPIYRSGEFYNLPQASLASVVSLAKEKGYELVAVTGVNAVLIKKELYHWFGIEDNAVKNYKIWTESRQFKFELELK